jgi:nitrile hydratase subunit beta
MIEAEIVPADRETPTFQEGEHIRVATRVPIGHYRVPTYLRGKRGVVAKILKPTAIDNEEEGYGRNAGMRGHYYSVLFPMAEIWSDYEGAAQDQLQIEVFETWLERS